MIIIIEGPDETGKTKLAKAIVGWSAGCMLATRYIKSPAGKTEQWLPEWNEWAMGHWDSFNIDEVTVLDRTPEMSEPVYAWAMNRGTRHGNPITALNNWHVPGMFLIHAQTDASIPLQEEHLDAFGDDVAGHHWRVSVAYDFLVSMLSTRITTFRWNRFTTDTEEMWFKLMQELAFNPYSPEWLLANNDLRFWEAAKKGEEWLTS